MSGLVGGLGGGRGRLAAVGLTAVALIVAAILVPVPAPAEFRESARALGTWAPVTFLLVHTLVTTTPLPRTALTLTAGVLFGPWLGLVLSLVASFASAVLAFAAARALGGRAVERLGPGRVRVLERRLAHRAVLTVVSTRMVPAIPFALLNYTLAVTTIGWRPYLLGTAIGLVPGTTAVVVLGDAATGTASPGSVLVFAASATLGVLGVAWSARRLPEPEPDAGSGPDRDAGPRG